MDLRRTKHVDDNARRWDLRYGICNFERNQCQLGSSDDAMVLSAPWPSMAIVIVVGQCSLGSAVGVRRETAKGRWLFCGMKYAD